MNARKDLQANMQAVGETLRSVWTEVEQLDSEIERLEMEVEEVLYNAPPRDEVAEKLNRYLDDIAHQFEIGLYRKITFAVRDPGDGGGKLKTAFSSDLLRLFSTSDHALDTHAYIYFNLDATKERLTAYIERAPWAGVEGLRHDQREAEAAKLRAKIEELQARKAAIFTELRQAGLSVEEVTEPEAAQPAGWRSGQGHGMVSESTEKPKPASEEQTLAKPKRMVSKPGGSMVRGVWEE
jgi:hypothetical protein